MIDHDRQLAFTNFTNIALRKHTAMQCERSLNDCEIACAYEISMPDIMCHALWACSHAESLDDPGLRLDRPDLPGEELRTTNFGGGSISAKVKHKDPLPGDQVQVLSGMDPGRDIGSIKLDRYAPLTSIDCYRAAGYHKHKTSERPTVAGPTAGIV